MSILDDAVAQDLRAYAARVRSALADLGPENVDDLTDGLEANLADALADDRRQHRASLADEFGTPEAYAAELRTAAGMAPAGRPRRTFGDVLRAPDRRARAAGERLLGRLRERAWWPPVEEFALSLRPAWWVLRGWVVYQLVARLLGVAPAWLPQHGAAWLLLLGAVVASVQAGRRLWFTTRPATGVVRAVSVVAAVAVLPLVVWQNGQEAWARSVANGGWGGGTSYVEVPQDGVVVDGMPVSNLFVYDADGNPLTDVQVYDDRGRQVRTTYDEGTAPWYRPDSDDAWFFAPATSQDGRTRWNVYPLRGWSEQQFEEDEQTGDWGPPRGLAPAAPPFPFAKAPAILVSAADGASAGTAQDGTTQDGTSQDGTPQDRSSQEEATPQATTATQGEDTGATPDPVVPPPADGSDTQTGSSTGTAQTPVASTVAQGATP